MDLKSQTFEIRGDRSHLSFYARKFLFNSSQPLFNSIQPFFNTPDSLAHIGNIFLQFFADIDDFLHQYAQQFPVAEVRHVVFIIMNGGHRRGGSVLLIKASEQ